jgi:hypothetical protein
LSKICQQFAVLLRLSGEEEEGQEEEEDWWLLDQVATSSHLVKIASNCDLHANFTGNQAQHHTCKQTLTRQAQCYNQQSHGAEHIVIRNNAARSHSVNRLIRALLMTLAAAKQNSAVPTSRLIAPGLRTFQFLFNW